MVYTYLLFYSFVLALRLWATIEQAYTELPEDGALKRRKM
jgi:hypothetical protein